MGGTGDEEGTCPNKETEENFPETRVEGSSNQDDDEILDTSLKKARYVWQIKGNYHLKCSGDEKERTTASECLPTELKQEAQIQPTNCCSSDSSEDSDDSEECNAFPAQSDEASSTSPSSRKRTSPVWYRPRPDWPVLKWQTRQVAKAFVDNTINCVLEDMGFVPLPADSVDILDEEFSAPQREQSDNSLEDKAVLMAIQSHGLQRSDQGQDASYQHSSTNYQKSERKRFCPSSFADLHCENSDIQQIHSAGQIISSGCKLQNILKAKPSECLSDGSNEGVPEIVGSSESQKLSDFESYFIHNKKCSVMQGNKVSDSSKIFEKYSCTCPARHCMSSEQQIGSTSQKISQESFLSCSDNFKDGTGNNPSYNVIQQCPGLRNSSLSVSLKRQAEEALSNNDTKRRCASTLSGSSDCLSSVNLSAPQSQASLVSDPPSDIEGKLQSFEHFDFMDAAVVAAIQKKGLSALACTEYG